MGCPCPCCDNTGACCVGGTCSQETCADCEALGGLWQGYGTACVSGACPCSPAADHTACERCTGGVVVNKCAAGEYCCDGVCKDYQCCTENADCDSGEWCCGGACTNLPDCFYVTLKGFDGSNVLLCTWYFPNTGTGVNDAVAFAATNPCAGALSYVVSSNQRGWCCDGDCYPDPGSLPAQADTYGVCP